MAEDSPTLIFGSGGVARGSTASLYHKFLIITTDFLRKIRVGIPTSRFKS